MTNVSQYVFLSLIILFPFTHDGKVDCGLAASTCSRNIVAVPAANAAATDVPDMVVDSNSPSLEAPTIESPGAAYKNK